MKKIIMMAVAAFMATVSANAQFEKGTWSLQPMLGGGVSTVINAKGLYIGNSKELSKKSSAASLIGVEAEYQFADKFSIAAGLNYTSQGCSWDDYNDGANKVKDIKVSQGYIKIPIVANYYIFKGFAVKAGIQFGFMTRSKFEMLQETQTTLLDGEARDVDVYYSVNYKDPFEKFDFSIPVGVSYQFKVPIVIDARYQIGLTNVNKLKVDGMKNFKNSVFMLTVGYKFAL